MVQGRSVASFALDRCCTGAQTAHRYGRNHVGVATVRAKPDICKARSDHSVPVRRTNHQLTFNEGLDGARYSWVVTLYYLHRPFLNIGLLEGDNELSSGRGTSG